MESLGISDPAAPAPAQSRYIDRDFSWLAFNRRVLAEARNAGNPLLERMKFLAIVAGNLDEFFEVRIAGLLQKVEPGVPVDGIAELDAKGLHMLGLADLGPSETEELRRRFQREIYPFLAPMKVDPAHTIPWALNKALCLGEWPEEGGKPGPSRRPRGSGHPPRASAGDPGSGERRRPSLRVHLRRHQAVHGRLFPRLPHPRLRRLPGDPQQHPLWDRSIFWTKPCT